MIVPRLCHGFRASHFLLQIPLNSLLMKSRPRCFMIGGERKGGEGETWMPPAPRTSSVHSVHLQTHASMPATPSFSASSLPDCLDTAARMQGKGSVASLLEQLKDGEATSLAARGASPLQQGLRGKGAASPRAQQSKFRKDSVDRDSLRTREIYQSKQAERIRVAFKEGKRREVLVRATTRLAEPAIWDVPCNAEFYDGAYGVVKGCTPSIMKCSRIVHDGFGRLAPPLDALTSPRFDGAPCALSVCFALPRHLIHLVFLGLTVPRSSTCNHRPGRVRVLPSGA